MNELRELYQQVIMDHNRHPRNYRVMENATIEADGKNPLCGDHIHVYVRLANGLVEEVTFDGAGCAIAKASASVMTEMVKGKTMEETQELLQRFMGVVTSDSTQELSTEGLGKLAVFAGVREFPARVKCASLAWRTLEAALAGSDIEISTE